MGGPNWHWFKIINRKIDELKTQNDKISWYLLLSRGQMGKPHELNRNRTASVSLSKSRKLAFRLELELSFRNSTGGLGVACAQVAPRGPVPGLRACFWTPFLFSGPVLDPLYLPEACFWSLFFCAGLFLDPPCLPQTCFWNPCVFHGPVFGLLCPRACFYMSFVFRGRVFGLPLLCLPPWVCFWIPSLGSLVVRFGAPFWCRWSVLGLRFGASGASWGFRLVDFHGTILQTPQIQCPKA